MPRRFEMNTPEEEARIQAGINADPDNPEWTGEDFARARPASEVVPEVVAAFRRPRGRPPGQTKTPVTLRVDTEVLRKLRASGPGWQSRANEALRKLVAG